MIPKIIHYCWFGGSPLPSEYKIYIDEWKALHAEWEIKRWDETNFPIDNFYMENALGSSNWANASNYARLRVINDYGGIYLDTDVKLIEPLDPLINYECFLGFEEGELNSDIFWVNNAVYGAIPHHPFSKKCLAKITADFDGYERPNESSPKLATQVLIEEYQLKSYGQQILADDIHLFGKDVFYPIPWNLVKNTLNYKDYTSSNTIGVHMWGRTWFTREMMLEMIDDLQYWSHNLEKDLSSNKAIIGNLTEQNARFVAEIDLLQKQIGDKDNKIHSLQEINGMLEKLLLERASITGDHQTKSQSYLDDKLLNLEVKLEQHDAKSLELLANSNEQLLQVCSLIERQQLHIQKLQNTLEHQQDISNKVNSEKDALINQITQHTQELNSLIERQFDFSNRASLEKQELLKSYQSEIDERRRMESNWAEQKKEFDSRIAQNDILANKLMGDITYYQESIKRLEKEYDQKSILEAIKAKIKI